MNPVCKDHSRLAKKNCRYHNFSTACNLLIWDVCLYSRQHILSKISVLNEISNLLCTKYFTIQTDNLEEDESSKLLISPQIDGQRDKTAKSFFSSVF